MKQINKKEKQNVLFAHIKVKSDNNQTVTIKPTQ